MTVTVRDIRRLGWCMSGARAWFLQHGLDWRDFVRNGIAEEELLKVGDHYAVTIVEEVRRGRGQ